MPRNAPTAKTIVLSDKGFIASMAVIMGCYLLLIIAMIGYDILYMVEANSDGGNPILEALQQPEIRYSINLSLISFGLPLPGGGHPHRVRHGAV